MYSSILIPIDVHEENPWEKTIPSTADPIVTRSHPPKQRDYLLGPVSAGAVRNSASYVPILR